MRYSRILISSFAFAAMANAAVSFYQNYGGYDADMPKSIILKSSTLKEGMEFTIGHNGNVDYTGKISAGSNPDNWLSTGESFFVADFSEFKTPGSYSLTIMDNGTPIMAPASVLIGDKQMYQSTFAMVLDYFYNDRATKYATKATVYPSESSIDVSGGWYDASGDASKYLSHLSYANYLNPQQIPLTVWALAFTAEKNPKLLESMSKLTSTKEEVAYGADFLVRMQSSEGYFYMTVFDNWGKPGSIFYLCEFTGSDGIKSANYQTAYRQGGGMAIAGLARAASQNISGSFTAQQYLETAKKGFEHLESKQSIGGSCEYCNDKEENIIDDYTALLATAELYNATKESKYLEVARKRAEHLAGRVSKDGYFWSDEAKTRPFWHASDAGLPLVALVRYLELETDAEKSEAIQSAAKKHLDWMLKVTEFNGNNPFGYARQTYLTVDHPTLSKTDNSPKKIKDGFFIPHDNESNYWWQGESARLGSLSAAAIYAARILNYKNMDAVNKYAADQLDWILGKNPYAISFMKGIGTKNPANYKGQRLNLTLNGGIANGITGYYRDGSGIAWNDSRILENTWDAWRFEEQWLPHSTWFLMALSTRYDEVKTAAVEKPQKTEEKEEGKEEGSKTDEKPADGDKEHSSATYVMASSAISFTQSGHTLNISGSNLQGRKAFLFGINGQVLQTASLQAGSNTIELSQSLKGVYILKIDGMASRKIMLK